MDRKLLSIGGALAGAALMATFGADVAEAGRKPKRVGENLICKAGTAVFKDNTVGKVADLCQYSAVSTYHQYYLQGISTKIKPTGAGGLKTLSLYLSTSVDVRETETTFPVVCSSGAALGDDAVVGSYSTVSMRFVADPAARRPRIPTGSIEETTTSWAIDGSAPFTVTISKFQAATNRIFGTFSGTMIAGDSNPEAGDLAFTKGKFVAVVNFGAL